jgi:DNA-binding LacI/PurR family transcriptional regulator
MTPARRARTSATDEPGGTPRRAGQGGGTVVVDGGGGRTARMAHPTLEDVAARAGVSRATASRVVNGAARVAPATRRAVETAIDQLGYSPNQAARNLAASRNDTVALVVCEPSGRFFRDPYFGQVIRGVAAELGPTRYQLVLLMVQGEDDRARAQRHLVRGNADGVLLVSTRADDPLPGRLAAAGVPCVLAGRPPEGVEVGYVDADNVGGAGLAVTHLLGCGRKVIGTVAGPADMAAGADRLDGWHKALADAGRPAPTELVAFAPFTRPGGEHATHQLLARRPDLDGLFVASDLMALGALDALRRAGRRVPEDVGVVGFDDSELAREARPALTTVRQPIEGLGRELAAALLEQLDGDRTAPPAAVVLKTELVLRASS